MILSIFTAKSFNLNRKKLRFFEEESVSLQELHMEKYYEPAFFL